MDRAITFGLVGESGCGKSTVAFGIVDFLGPNGKITGGSIMFQGSELVGRSQKELRLIRGDQISMVYQDPMQALNPSLTLGEQLSEVLTVHRGLSIPTLSLPLKGREGHIETLDRDRTAAPVKQL